MKQKWSLNKIKKQQLPSSEAGVSIKVIGSTIFILSNLMATGPALAACTSPSADAGAWNYFASEDRFKYCDGTNWKLETKGLLKKLPGGGEGVLYFGAETCQSGGTINVISIADDADGSVVGVMCFDFVET